MKKILTFALALLPLFAIGATRLSMSSWEAVVGDDNKLNLYYNKQLAFADVYCTTNYRYVVNTERKGALDSRTLSPKSVQVVDIEDEFGQGKSLQIEYPGTDMTMVHSLNFYPQYNYFLAQVTLRSDNGDLLAANRMNAFITATRSEMIQGSDYRVLWVPYSNDGHTRYKVYKLTQTVTSYEATTAFEPMSRFGFVAGSVDHDKWKNAVITTGGYSKYLEKIQCLSGIADEQTHDYDIPHGWVQGLEVESARFMIGMFDDWRVGMETFADACCIVAPRPVWEGGNPVGYSSWGNTMNYVSYQGLVETAQFMHDNLKEHGFHGKDGCITMSLDSFAEMNMGTSLTKFLGTKVWGKGTYREGATKKEGIDMHYGLYGGIVIWDWTVDETIAGTGIGGVPTYKWRDCLLKANGESKHVFPYVQYLAIDPTHPAVEKNLEHTFARWADYNVKYVKMDFIDAAICEGDSWYRPEITTGTMAYNYIMNIMLKLANKYDMYVVEAMSPLFPYQYAHGRRTMCDRFSSLDESEYMMNGTCWGWWTDRLYTVNDPDNLTFHRDNNKARETIGENRVRASTGVCTGAYIFGDNFSDNCLYPSGDTNHTPGTPVGYPASSRARALKIMTNEDINQYVREHIGSFRPVEGGEYTASQQAESKYMRDTEQYLYVAAFNWNMNNSKTDFIAWDRLDIDPANVGEIKELWSGEYVTAQADGLHYTLPGGDVKIFRIAKNDYDGVEEIEVEKEPEGEPTYYNLQGVKVGDNFRGICIKVVDGKATKIAK